MYFSATQHFQHLFFFADPLCFSALHLAFCTALNIVEKRPIVRPVANGTIRPTNGARTAELKNVWLLLAQHLTASAQILPSSLRLQEQYF